MAYTDRLTHAGIRPSVESVGNRYAYALAWTVNGLYKTEMIYKHPAWKLLTEVAFDALH